MAAITWRSMAAPDLTAAAAPLDRARTAFNDGFSSFNNVIKQQQTIEDANFQAAQEVAKNAYLDQLQAAATPEQLAAQKASLDQARAALNPLVRAQVRGAEENRNVALQKNFLANQEYADKKTTLDQRDTVKGIMTDVYSMTPEGLTRAQEALKSNPQLMNSPDIQKSITEYQRKLVEQGRGDDRWKWDTETQAWNVKERGQKEKLFPLEIQAKQAGINASNAQVAASGESLAATKEQRARNTEAYEADKIQKKLNLALEGNMYKEGVYKDADIEGISKLMVDNKIGGTESDAVDKRSHIVQTLTELAKNGGIEISHIDAKTGNAVTKTVPLPLGTVKAAILASRDKPFAWNGGWAKTFEEVLRSKLESSYDKEGSAANRAVDDYQNYLTISGEAAKLNTTPSSKKKSK